MAIVSNIEITNISLVDKKTPDMLKCIEILSEAKIDYTTLLPKQKQYQVRCIITGRGIANALRRCILGEIPIKSFFVPDFSIVSDDRFIVNDYVAHTLGLIPINQDINTDELHISLRITNGTKKTIKIYSHNIEIINKKTKERIDTNKLVSSNICICYLRPTRFLHIDNIEVITGTANENGGKFHAVDSIYYDILDHDPTKRSIEQMPIKYALGYSTYGNIEPKKIMRLACSTMTERVNNIMSDISLAQPGESYLSTIMRIEYVGEIMNLYIFEEYRTLANLITHYCYKLDPSIPFIVDGIIHPSKNQSLLKIIHGEPIRIVMDAMQNIITDLATISSAFE